jgi:hypothetical protein
MDEKVEGPKSEEPTVPPTVDVEGPPEPVQAEAQVPPTAGAGPVEPYYRKALTGRDWMFFALIGVSVIAILLLAATITLAVTHGGNSGRRFGRCPMIENDGPGRFPGGIDERGFRRNLTPDRQERMRRLLPENGSEDSGDQSEPQQDQNQPTPPPAPGQAP